MQRINWHNSYQRWSAYASRQHSVELDFGANWRMALDFAQWRIIWIEDTGELYALALEGPRPDRYFVIGSFTTEDEVERAMAGWADCEKDLRAIVAQARGGAKVTPYVPPEIAEPTYPDLSGVSFRGLDFSSLDTPPDVKVYIGQRPTDSALGDCRVLVVLNGKAKPLHHIVIHSPTGYEWGFSGSGPADLALSILADYFGERPRKFNGTAYAKYKCLRLYQEFKSAFIAGAPREGFTLTGEQIAAWLAKQEE